MRLWLPKDRQVYIYCLSGGRSHSAADKLRTQGYTVYEMEGGILQWQKADFRKQREMVRKERMGCHSMNLIKWFLHTLCPDWFQALPGADLGKKMYIDAIEKEMNGALKVVVINTDENMTLVKKMKIYSIPTCKLYRDGKLKWENMGFTDEKYPRRLSMTLSDYQSKWLLSHRLPFKFY